MNLLEELVFCCGIDKEWQDKIEAAEDTGFSTANCNSINVIQDYVISQQERIKELEGEVSRLQKEKQSIVDVGHEANKYLRNENQTLRLYLHGLLENSAFNTNLPMESERLERFLND